MKVKVDSEDIATIRNALTIIQLNAELIAPGDYHGIERKTAEIIKQVKRIDKLLPGGKPARAGKEEVERNENLYCFKLEERSPRS